ncbi:MAG: hypothetical protein ACK4RN_06945 [Pseudorhodobacter sp.]
MPAKPQQGDTQPSPQQQQGQQSGTTTPQQGQPIFRDWASI